MNDQAHDEKAPVWWPLVSMVLALVGGLGLAGLAVKWFSAGHPIAGFIAAAAMVGWLAGLYPDKQGR